MNVDRAISCLLALWLALAVGFFVLADAAWAQDLDDAASTETDETAISLEDYEGWEPVSRRAEEALASGRASNRAFDELRKDLVEWRARFLEDQSANAARIATLQARLEALGPPPEGDATESPEVAALRDRLSAELQSLRAPVIEATEAHAHANALIQRIDRLLRERQQQGLVDRGPMPIAPGNLKDTGQDLRTVWRILTTEVETGLKSRRDSGTLVDALVLLVLLPAVALLLLLRGQSWFQRLVVWMVRLGGSDERYLVVAMIVSLGQVFVPVLGLVLLVAGVLVAGVTGASTEALLLAVPEMGIAFFGARWLGGQTFPRLEKWPTPLDLSPRERVRGRFYTSSLGILVAIAIFLREAFSTFTLEPASPAVLGLPVIVLSAICLAGLARLLIAHGRRSLDTLGETPEDPDTPDERSFLDRVLLLIGRGCLLLAFVGPVLAVVGYGRAATYFTLAPGLTLGLFAVVSYLQRLAIQIIALFTPTGRKPTDSLWPVLFTIAIMIAALPFLAMIWGVRAADLEELWNALRGGFVVGDTRISPSAVFLLLVVFLLGYSVTRLVQGLLRNSVLPRTRLDLGAQKAMVSGFGYLGIFLAALLAISAAGIGLSNIAIVAGALSVGVGFGLQNIVSNFVSGLILLIERPVTEGDWIEVGGVMGTVRRISVRATTVETFDRTDVVVPNSDLISNQVTNWTRGNLNGRLILPVGVAYGSDTRKVAEILQEIAEAHPLVIVNPPPMIVFQGFGADALEFEMRVILRDINFGLGTRTELNHQIAERFAAEGIEVPFAQRDIWLRNPEALRPAVERSDGTPPPTPAPMRPDADPEFPTEDES